MSNSNKAIEFLLLCLLALLWGSSYLFIKIAVAEIPPITLIAVRVSLAAVFLMIVMKFQAMSLPHDVRTWRMLLVQAFFNSIGAWTILAWGQQYVDAGLASVLNSTSPIFVILLTAILTEQENPNKQKIAGAFLGISGVLLIVGVDVLAGLGEQVAGQLACLFGAALYASGAIYGKRFEQLNVTATATGTLICASIVLVPLALVLEQPITSTPSTTAVAATIVLSIFCTGVALLIYFRLIRTIGSMGVASQSYLRAGVGVVLSVLILGEAFTIPMSIGLILTILGVILINWPKRLIRS